MISDGRGGAGGVFIPIERFNIVADKLFVVAERAGPDLVRIGRPKT